MVWPCRLARQQDDAHAHFELTQKAFRRLPESREIALAFHESSLSSAGDEAETAFGKHYAVGG